MATGAPPRTKTIPVVEIFGPTIQGEGPLAGAVSHFVRVGACDYRCVWCDSAHAVLPEEVRSLAKRLTEAEIAAAVRQLPSAKWVTISGGNPGLYDLGLLVDDLHEGDYAVAVETQGSRYQHWFDSVDQLTISPKPPSSGMATDTHRRALEDFLGLISYATNPVFKVPIFDKKDFVWAMELHNEWSWVPFYLSVVTSMGGLYGDFNEGRIDTSEDVLERYRQVVEWTLNEPWAFDVKVIPQLHVLLFGSTTRGV